MELIDYQKRIYEFFRPRDKENGETLTEYVKALVKKLEERVGFTEFHLHINQVLKTHVGKEIATKYDWSIICSYITNYEGMWLTAIGEYLSPEQIAEWEKQ